MSPFTFYPANNARPLRPTETTRKSLLCVWLRHALFARDKRGIMQGMDDPSLIRCVHSQGLREERVNWYISNLPWQNVRIVPNFSRNYSDKKDAPKDA